jgi:hypothetical protein
MQNNTLPEKTPNPATSILANFVLIAAAAGNELNDDEKLAPISICDSSTNWFDWIESLMLS